MNPVVNEFLIPSSPPPWQDEIRQAIKSRRDLEMFLKTSIPATPYQVFLPRTLAKKIQIAGPNSPLWRQFIPHRDENAPEGDYDPIGDKNFSRPGGIIHRYNNRLLFFPTMTCPIVCRYCFRKNEIENHDDIFKSQLSELIHYLQLHPEVNEVILSGGDPLMLSTKKLQKIADQLLDIKTIKYFRLHTRTPLVLPSRIDSELVDFLADSWQKFTHFQFMIHLNHPDELDCDVTTALKQLLAKVPVVKTQTVLLKGVNDSAETLKTLFTQIIDLKMSPYYLHHPDQVLGGKHFYLSIEEGRKIYLSLRNQLPGWALPHYVLDLPGGKGKVLAIGSEQLEFSGHFINKDLQLIEYRNLF